jgi:hypothetical protein
MARLHFTGPVRPGKLLEELIAAIPACAPVPGPLGPVAVTTVETPPGSGPQATECWVTVPDTVAPAAVAAVVAAHNAATPSAGEQQSAADTVTLADLRTQYQTMKAGLGTIRTHMATIQASANPTTANLASLQRVVDAVKQVSTDITTMTNGLDRLLDTLAVFVRRQGGGG